MTARLLFWCAVAVVFYLIARRPSSAGRYRWLGDVWKERDVWVPAAMLSTVVLSGFFGFLIWKLWPVIRCGWAR